MCHAVASAPVRAGEDPAPGPDERKDAVTTTILICIAGWILGWVALGRARRVGDLPEGSDDLRPGSCTVIVPARNEERSIGLLVADLRSDPALDGCRILVVDDHSNDDTARVAASHRAVDVVAAPPLPPAWTGKSWACQHGADLAARDADHTLVFLDADVRPAPGSLSRLIEHRGSVGGLVSAQPWHVAERPAEQLSCLFNVVAVMGAGSGAGDRATGAFGPVMVSSRGDYERAGGHASVRGEVVEDLALAHRYRADDQPVSVFQAGPELSYRMYPEGLGQLVEGWTKNFAVGAVSTPLLRLAAIVVWMTALASAALALVDGARGAEALSVGVALYVAFAAQLGVMFRTVGRFRTWTALAYPVPLCLFLVVFVRSLWRTHVRHSVTWRGRTIPVARSRG